VPEQTGERQQDSERSSRLRNWHRTEGDCINRGDAVPAGDVTAFASASAELRLEKTGQNGTFRDVELARSRWVRFERFARWCFWNVVEHLGSIWNWNIATGGARA
jgi:hypothetical protein